MNNYHIADVERLTGIKAHTIRIWEKRYNIVSPHRTDTNIRYYDDNQLRKLLNVATLLQQGQKISSISTLSEKEISERIRDTEIKSDDAIINNYVNNLVSFMIDFDEDGFEKTFSSAVNRLGVFNAMLNVFYPFLYKTGTLWSVEDIIPAQEHFAMNIIKRKLIAAIDGLPPATKKDKKFILFLPPQEWHEMSLLFADYIIKSNGYSTLYLGQNVPYENLEETIAKYKPTHLLGFYIAEKNTAVIETAINSLAKKNAKLSIFISGSSLMDKEWKFFKNITQVKDPLALNALLVS